MAGKHWVGGCRAWGLASCVKEPMEKPRRGMCSVLRRGNRRKKQPGAQASGRGAIGRHPHQRSGSVMAGEQRGLPQRRRRRAARVSGRSGAGQRPTPLRHYLPVRSRLTLVSNAGPFSLRERSQGYGRSQPSPRQHRARQLLPRRWSCSPVWSPSCRLLHMVGRCLYAVCGGA